MAKYIPVAKAIEQLTGIRPNPTTCWRWCVKDAAGVRLQSWLIGNRRMTTLESVERWIEARAHEPSPAEQSDQVADKLRRELGASK